MLQNFRTSTALSAILCALLWTFPQRTIAQLVGGNAFMQGDYIEVGIGPCGMYGTTAAPPAGYHPRSNAGNSLGFVADFQKDGWNNGTPDYCGDYFTPGNPLEGWGLQIGTDIYMNAGYGAGIAGICDNTDIPGSNTTFSNTGGLITSVWDGNIAGINVVQTSSLIDTNLYFVTKIELCNNTDSVIRDVYYMRMLNPDNEQSLTGNYATTLNIERQPNIGLGTIDALVTARGATDPDCFVGLGTKDSRARGAWGSFTFNPGTSTDSISDVYAGNAPYTTDPNDSTLNQNSSFYLVYYIPEIDSFSCECLAYAYILNSSDLDEALESTVISTVTANGRDITFSDTAYVCDAGGCVEIEIFDEDSSGNWTWSPSENIVGDTTGNSITVCPDSAVSITATLDTVLNSCQEATKELVVLIDSAIFTTEFRVPTDTTICQYYGLPLPVGFGFDLDVINWYDEQGNLIFADTDSIFLVADTTVTYAIEALTFAGCAIFDTFTVTVIPGFTLSATISADTVCRNQAVALTSTPSPPNPPSGDYSYLWTPTGSVLDSSAQNTVSVDLGGSQTFVITIEDTASTCAYSDTVEVVISGVSPEIDLADIGYLCFGDSLQLDATGYFDTLLSEDFNDTIFSGLIDSIEGGLISANCGTSEGAGALYFNGNPRQVTTAVLDMTEADTLFFDIVFGSTSGGVCDDSEFGEDVALEYSTDGGSTWQTSLQYQEFSYPVWTTIAVPIAAPINVNGIKFRWRQIAHSASGADNWGIDNIRITGRTEGNYGYSWSPNYNISGTSIPNPLVWPATDTTYVVLVVDSSNSDCNLLDSIRVQGVPEITVDILASDTAICGNDPFNLSAAVNPAGTYLYEWEPESLLANADQASPTLSSDLVSNTTFTVVVTDSLSGCAADDSIDISVKGFRPELDMAPTDTFCFGDSSNIPLDISVTIDSVRFYDFEGGTGDLTVVGASLGNPCGTGAGAQAINFDGATRTATTPVLDLSAGGTITFDIYFAAGGSAPCESPEFNEDVVIEYSDNGGLSWFNLATIQEDSVSGSWYRYSLVIPVAAQSSVTQIRWRQLTFSPAGNDNWGLDNIRIPVQVGIDSGFAFAWTPNVTIDDTSSRNPLVWPSGNQVYNVSAWYQDTGCSVEDSILIVVAPDFLYTLFADDDTICENAQTNIGIAADTNFGPFQYQWAPAAYLKDSTTESVVAIPKNSPTTYSVTVTAAEGCQSIDSIDIYISGLIPQVTAIADSQLCFGDTGQLRLQLTVCDSVVNDSFESGTNPALWSAINGGATNANCGVNNGAAALWFDNATNRFARTNAFDASGGMELSFAIYIPDTNSANCNTPEPGEEPFLEVSTDGGFNYTPVATYSDDSLNSWTTLNYTFTAGQLSNNTVFRWSQNVGFTGFDHFAIDDVVLRFCFTIDTLPPGYTVSWEPKQYVVTDSTETALVNPPTETVFSAIIDDGSGCQGSGSVVQPMDNQLLIAAGPDFQDGCIGSAVQLYTSVFIDTSDYTLCDQYDVDSIGFSTIGGFGTALNLGDDQVSFPIPLGFDFDFFCNTYTQAFVSSNGFLTFTNTFQDGCCAGQVLPDPTDPDNLIAFAWEDLSPTFGNIRYFTSGAAPNRIFVLNFTNVQHGGGGNQLTTQLQLYEGSNIIEIHTTSNPLDGDVNGHTMGIENATGSVAYTVSGRNGTTGWGPVSNDAWRFSPVILPLPSITYDWMPNGLVSNDTIADPTYTFGGSQDLVVQVSNGTCAQIDSVQMQLITGETDTLEFEVCSGDSVNGTQVNADTVWTDSFQSVKGCDSLVRYEVSVLESPSDSSSDSLCPGDTVIFGGNPYTMAGTYGDTFTGQNGCDSVSILVLTQKSPESDTSQGQVCAGTAFVFGGNNYFQAGTYADTFTGQNGCDSISVLELTVFDTFRTSIDTTICAGDIYTLNGIDYTADGSYSDTLNTVNGCDSIFDIRLRVNDSFRVQNPQSICAGETYSNGGNTYSNSGIYRDTFSMVDGCDSIVVTDLTVGDTFRTTIDTTICAGDIYSLNGVDYTSTNTYFDTLSTVDGCDSIFQINLTVNDSFRTSIDTAICAGEIYTLNGIDYTADGSYADTLTTIDGCDSIFDIRLRVSDTFRIQNPQTICAGETYSNGGNTYSTSGIYRDTFSTVDGCDSIVVTDLTVGDTFRTTIDTTICAGDIYTLHGLDYTAANTYFDTLQTVDGCDSIFQINLTVNDSFRIDIDTTICAGEIYTLNGIDYTADGSYADTLTTIDGCDSIFDIRLRVSDTFRIQNPQIICAGETYSNGGNTYSTSGIYRDTFSTVDGCDSIVVTDLTVNDTFRTTIDTTICAGDIYTLHGQDYTAANTYFDTLPTVDGCDSIFLINLTVNDSFRIDIDTTICAGEIYTLNGTDYTMDGVYADTLTTIDGCDSIFDIRLRVNDTFRVQNPQVICAGETYSNGGNTYSISGTYRDTFPTVNGCDSIVVTDLTVNDTFRIKDTVQICQGDTHFVGNSAYTDSGDYVDSFLTMDGCDSIIETHLIALPNSFLFDTIVICEDDSVFLQGAFQDTSGTYFDTFANALLCDSVVQTELLVQQKILIAVEDTLCDGDTIVLGSLPRTTSGVYFDTIFVSEGCDSVFEHTVTFNPVSFDSVYREICDGDSFPVGGTFYNTDGIYYDTLLNEFGCDSVVTWELVFDTTIRAFRTITICAGETFFVEGANQSVAGNYFDTTSAAFGCDSVTVTNLVVNDTQRTIIDTAICQGDVYTLHGLDYSIPGSYEDTLSNQFGCDSLFTINLTVNDTFELYDTTGVICQGDFYNFGGVNYTAFADTTFRLDFVSSTGCDSSWIVQIDVNDTFYQRVDTAEICQGEFYEFGGVNYAATTDTTFLVNYTSSEGCDSTYEVFMAVNDTFYQFVIVALCEGDSHQFGGQFYKANDDTVFIIEYVDTEGCDSTYELRITYNDTFYELVDTPVICQGELYNFAGVDYTAFQDTTFFVDYLSAIGGCDSTYEIRLGIRDTFYDEIDTAVICQGGFYSFGGVSYTAFADTNFTVVYTSSEGCDSTFYIEISVNDTFRFAVFDSICQGDDYLFGGVTYRPIDDSSWTVSYQTVDGCDSVYELNVFVGDTFRFSVPDTICEGDAYTFGGVSFFPTDDSVWIVSYQTQYGCDSLYDLEIVVLDTFEFTFTDSICQGDSFVFDGLVYSPETDTVITVNYSTAFGCDSTWLLNITVSDTFRATVFDTICQGESYSFGGFVFTPQDDSSFMVNLLSINGCDSMYDIELYVSDTFRQTVFDTLCEGQTYSFGGVSYLPTDDSVFTVRYIDQFGCDSVYDIDLLVNDTFGFTFLQSVCLGDTFLFAGTSYLPNVDTNILVQYSTVNGCDSSWYLDVKVNDTFRFFRTDTICEGGTFNFDGTPYRPNDDTIFEVFYFSTFGCDSVIVVDLDVMDTFNFQVFYTICQGELISFGGVNYTAFADTVVRVVYPSIHGCDSVYELQIEVNDTFMFRPDTTICKSDPYSFNGQTFFPAADTSILFRFQTIHGCDSTYEIDVFVRDTFNVDDTIRVCRVTLPYPFGPANLTVTGDYIDTFVTVDGCDSVVNLRFEVYDTSGSFTIDTVCDNQLPYQFHTNFYSSSGYYVDTLVGQNQFGCDSIIQLDLTVLPTSSFSFADTICEGVDYPFGAFIYRESGSYFDTVPAFNGCDSFVRVDLTVIPLGYTPLYLADPASFEVAQGLQVSIEVIEAQWDGTWRWNIRRPKEDLREFDLFPNGVMIDSPTSDPVFYTLVYEYECDTTETEIRYDILFFDNFVLPGVFSPNNDGVNDDFYVVFPYNNDQGFIVEEFTIFGRWGQHVIDLPFDATSPGNGWDGKDKNGRDVPAGTYIWHLVVRNVQENELLMRTGTITVIR